MVVRDLASFSVAMASGPLRTSKKLPSHSQKSSQYQNWTISQHLKRHLEKAPRRYPEYPPAFGDTPIKGKVSGNQAIFCALWPFFPLVFFLPVSEGLLPEFRATCFSHRKRKTPSGYVLLLCPCLRPERARNKSAPTLAWSVSLAQVLPNLEEKKVRARR